ncbi:MAG: acyl-CoA thioesterase [Planctomycetota bacterium]
MFVTSYVVRFADVDNAGIFYYPRFFHAFHVAFEKWWAEGVGRPYHLVLNEDKVGFPAVHIECDFNRPVTFGDPMEIRVSVRRIGRRSVTFRYEVAHRETEEVHCAADITKAIVDMESWRPVEPPPAIRRALESILVA